MIGSHATSRSLPDGGYHGIYKPFWTKDQSIVTDADGNKLVFRDKWEAEATAWRECKKVEHDRLNALRADPTQIQDAGRWYDRNTRMRAQSQNAITQTAEAVFKREEERA
jgi:hypothetical protein